MTPRAGKQFRRSAQVEDLAIRHRHAAGIDVHSREHFVAVAAADVPVGFVNADRQLPREVRKFGTNTGDLEALAAWLKDCGAIVAAARKIAERVYRLLTYGQEYVRQSQDLYEQAYQQRLHKSLAKKAASLGYPMFDTCRHKLLSGKG